MVRARVLSIPIARDINKGVVMLRSPVGSDIHSLPQPKATAKDRLPHVGAARIDCEKHKAQRIRRYMHFRPSCAIRGMMARRGGKCSIWRFCVTAQDKLLADKIPVTSGDEALAYIARWLVR